MTYDLREKASEEELQDEGEEEEEENEELNARQEKLAFTCSSIVQ